MICENHFCSKFQGVASAGAAFEADPCCKLFPGQGTQLLVGLISPIHKG